MSGSPFLEDQALHAAMNDDADELQRVLHELLPGELTGLAQACDQVADEARRIRQGKLNAAHAIPTERGDTTPESQDGGE